MFCFVGNVARAAEMGSVPFVAKMESITLWAILCLTKTTTTKSVRNTGERRLGNHVKETQAVNISNKKRKAKRNVGVLSAYLPYCCRTFFAAPDHRCEADNV